MAGPFDTIAKIGNAETAFSRIADCQTVYAILNLRAIWLASDRECRPFDAWPPQVIEAWRQRYGDLIKKNAMGADDDEEQRVVHILREIQQRRMATSGKLEIALDGIARRQAGAGA